MTSPISRKRAGSSLIKTSKRVQLAIDAIQGMLADEVPLQPEYEDSRLGGAPTWYGDWEGWTPEFLSPLLYTGLVTQMSSDDDFQLDDWIHQLRALRVTHVDGVAMHNAHVRLKDQEGDLHCDPSTVVDALHLAGKDLTADWVALVKANGVGTSVLLKGLYEYLVSEFVNQ